MPQTVKLVKHGHDARVRTVENLSSLDDIFMSLERDAYGRDCGCGGVQQKKQAILLILDETMSTQAVAMYSKVTQRKNWQSL